MRILMINKSFPNGEANVLHENQAKWEAAGWVAVPQEPKKTKPKKEIEQ